MEPVLNERDVGERLAALRNTLGAAKKALILCHNDPDPDAISSALATGYLLAEAFDIEGELLFKGIIGRAENRALVKYLGNPLRPVTDRDWRRGLPVVLVDTQPGAGNNALPEEIQAAAVIDHHPWRPDSSKAAYVDVRPNYGATATILTEYLRGAGLDTYTELATALFYGVKSDTMGLIRGAKPPDLEAYCYLQSRVDLDALGRIELAQLPSSYFRSFTTAISAAQVQDKVVTVQMGHMDYPDQAAEVADMLVRLMDIEWVICSGTYEDHLILSVRTTKAEGGAGRLIQQMVNGLGTAGGHGTNAGGSVPLRGRSGETLAGQLVSRALTLLNIDPNLPTRSVI